MPYQLAALSFIIRSDTIHPHLSLIHGQLPGGASSTNLWRPGTYIDCVTSSHPYEADTGRRGAAILPSLPDILSSSINQQVFTHRSFYGRPVHVFEDHPGDLSPDNER